MFKKNRIKYISNVTWQFHIHIIFQAVSLFLTCWRTKHSRTEIKSNIYVPTSLNLHSRDACGVLNLQLLYSEICAIFLYLLLSYFPFLSISDVYERRRRDLAFKSVRGSCSTVPLTRLHRDGRKRTTRLIVGKSHRERMKYREVANSGEKKTERTSRSPALTVRIPSRERRPR